MADSAHLQTTEELFQVTLPGGRLELYFPVPGEYVSVPPPHRDEQRRLSYESTLKLKQWMARPEHWVFPYPSDTTKRELCAHCGMDMT